MKKKFLIFATFFLFNSFIFIILPTKKAYLNRVKKNIAQKNIPKKQITKNRNLPTKTCPCMRVKKKKVIEKKSVELVDIKVDIKKDAKLSVVENVITVQEAKENKNFAIYICVLPEEYFEKWHILGSINVPWDVIEKVAADWDKEKKIILYCFTDRTSGIAYNTLNNMGFKNIKKMVGGLKKWSEEGYSLEGSGTYEELLELIVQILSAIDE
ncbi:rhodanese-like domain-containing protein [Candidatus Babeliales bacterium]|nr:rhodanese-like domain-containing protein [Candidatus Babeliales bacterium]